MMNGVDRTAPAPRAEANRDLARVDTARPDNTHSQTQQTQTQTYLSLDWFRRLSWVVSCGQVPGDRMDQLASSSLFHFLWHR